MTETISLTADLALLTSATPTGPHVLLIRRADDSDAFPGYWALPGGYVEPGESSKDAAVREVREETGITVPVHRLTQVGAYDTPDRDPRGRVVSVAYTASLSAIPTPTAGSDAREAHWFPISEALTMPLAFDHVEILATAAYTTTNTPSVHVVSEGEYDDATVTRVFADIAEAEMYRLIRQSDGAAVTVDEFPVWRSAISSITHNMQ